MGQNDRAEEMHILQDIQKHGFSTSASINICSYIYVVTYPYLGRYIVMLNTTNSPQLAIQPLCVVLRLQAERLLSCSIEFKIPFRKWPINGL